MVGCRRLACAPGLHHAVATENFLRWMDGAVVLRVPSWPLACGRSSYVVVEKQISELPLGLTTNLRIAFRRHVSRLVGLVGARARVNGLSVACALSNSHVRMCAILVLQYMES